MSSTSRPPVGQGCYCGLTLTSNGKMVSSHCEGASKGHSDGKVKCLSLLQTLSNGKCQSLSFHQFKLSLGLIVTKLTDPDFGDSSSRLMKLPVFSVGALNLLPSCIRGQTKLLPRGCSCTIVLNVFSFLPAFTSLRSVVAIMGKGFSESAFTTVFLYTSELYPTILR